MIVKDITRVFWFDVLRHGLQVLAFCCVIALFTSVLWSDPDYARHLLYSVSIGGLTWLTMEFGRLLVPRRHCAGSREAQGHGWPTGWRGATLTMVGIAAGFFGGTRLVSALLHEPVQLPARDLRMVLAVTVAATLVASFFFFTRSRQAVLQMAIAAAERDASEARLALLQSQLEPHMLFNTLANLRALIAVDPPAAQRMLDRLDGYLRATLAASRATEHPVAAEFELLADYLELMAVRMGARLKHRLDLPDDLRALPVPTLLLQPLVENAIRHGLEPRVEGGCVEVTAARVAGRLVLSVHDTGAGFDPDSAPRAGHFGLAHVRERIASASGGRGRLELLSDPLAGTTARITLPLA